MLLSDNLRQEVPADLLVTSGNDQKDMPSPSENGTFYIGMIPRYWTTSFPGIYRIKLSNLR